jgi:CRP/FNR family transcriptional regulator, nitrogen oxide reductase regulator
LAIHFPAAASASPGSLSLHEGDVAELLARSELFVGVPKSDCMQIARSARTRNYSRNEFFFEQGQPIRTILLILSGSVKMTQLSLSGSEVILWLRGPGDAVGVFGIPSRSSHTCSARTIGQCRALSWEWSRLEELPSSPQIRENIGRIMSKRISELEVRFREIATEKVANRVAFSLLRILKQVGSPSHGGVQIRLSREELAQLTGTTLFTISRLMSKWNEQGIIEARREAVIIRDPVRLQQMCTEDA